MSKRSQYLPKIKEQKMCYDTINLEEEEIEQFLSTKNNVILTDIEVKQVGCSTLDNLKRLLINPSHVYYECIGQGGEVPIENPIIKIDVGSNQYYVPATELRSALRNQTWNFMSFEETDQKTAPLMSVTARMGETYVGAWHCQPHTRMTLSHVLTFNLDGEVQNHQSPQDKQHGQAQQLSEMTRAIQQQGQRQERQQLERQTIQQHERQMRQQQERQMRQQQERQQQEWQSVQQREIRRGRQGAGYLVPNWIVLRPTVPTDNDTLMSVLYQFDEYIYTTYQEYQAVGLYIDEDHQPFILLSTSPEEFETVFSDLSHADLNFNGHQMRVERMRIYPQPFDGHNVILLYPSVRMSSAAFIRDNMAGLNSGNISQLRDFLEENGSLDNDAFDDETGRCVLRIYDVNDNPLEPLMEKLLISPIGEINGRGESYVLAPVYVE